uniref:hypothetical protein n=1 Tax=Bacillus multifaciens TaxID=3068506 RepID=UPI003F497B19
MKYFLMSDYGEKSGTLDNYEGTLNEWKDRIINEENAFRRQFEVFAYDESKGETPDDANIILWLSVSINENGKLYWEEEKDIKLEFVTPVRNLKID